MWRHLPNALCVLRIILIGPIAALLLQGRLSLALLVFAFAALTDVLDGYLAKRFSWQTELGKRLDPLADKLLLVTVFVVVVLLGKAPLWLAATVVARDVIITAGGLIYLWLYGDPQGQPTVISKVNTFLQVTFVLGVVGSESLLDAVGMLLPVSFGGWLARSLAALGALAFVTTVVSGLDYVLRYAAKARVAQRGRQSLMAG
jgi:cardiolipin synthase